MMITNEQVAQLKENARRQLGDPATRDDAGRMFALCQRVLDEDDQDARDDIETMLDDINGRGVLPASLASDDTASTVTVADPENGQPISLTVKQIAGFEPLLGSRTFTVGFPSGNEIVVTVAANAWTVSYPGHRMVDYRPAEIIATRAVRAHLGDPIT